MPTAIGRPWPREPVATSTQGVVVGILGLVPVVLQIPCDQNRGEVGGGHRGRRMPGAGGGAGADGIDPQLLTQLARKLEIGGGKRLGGDGHLTPYHLRVAPPATQLRGSPACIRR